jgi:hypothetical protein
MWQLSPRKHQVLEKGRNKFQCELEALKLSNVKIETMIFELSDSRDEDVQKVFLSCFDVLAIITSHSSIIGH